MNRFTSLFLLAPIIVLSLFEPVPAQYTSTDSTLVQDAIYSRPFIGSFVQTSIGGYIEGNTNSFVTSGDPEGFSFEMRRFNIFIASKISNRITLMSELEFEHGVEEIALETALIDFEVNTALNFRGGILLTPIGSYNVNHDSPQWEFVDRPLVTTEIIPSTLSEMGVGIFGKFFPGDLTLTYDLYLTNGLSESGPEAGMVLNKEGRIRIASGKAEDQFSTSGNGRPSVAARLAVGNYNLGEIGFSYYGGIYNEYMEEGDIIDNKRRLDLVAVDYNAKLPIAEITGELVYANIDLDDDLKGRCGGKQWGGYMDIVMPVWKLPVFSYDGVLNANHRLEYVDFNMGNFSTTGGTIYDDTKAIVPGLSFRPTEGTVFRLNYIRRWHRNYVGNDIEGQPGGIQFGFATYF